MNIELFTILHKLSYEHLRIQQRILESKLESLGGKVDDSGINKF